MQATFSRRQRRQRAVDASFTAPLSNWLHLSSGGMKYSTTHASQPFSVQASAVEGEVETLAHTLMGLHALHVHLLRAFIEPHLRMFSGCHKLYN